MIKGNKEFQICHGLISQLPEEVVVEILVRISSVKTIALCKSVCKSWRSLISDPRFADLHLARSRICILVRNLSEDRTDRTLFLLEEEDGFRGFHSGHCICRPDSIMECCEICLSDTTEMTELKIPLGRSRIRIIENTCDGLLCLFSFKRAYTEVSPIAVCNPVTCEFVTLPDWEHRASCGACGLGLDQKTGRYKVVMLYSLPIPNSESGNAKVLKAAVYVLGTDSWREVNTPHMMLDSVKSCLSRPTLLDGSLHWVYTNFDNSTYRLVSFNLESERLCYRSLPPLPPRDDIVEPSDLAVEVLGRRLCVYPCCPGGKLYMCTIDKCSVTDSSSDEWISHDLSEVQDYLQLLFSFDDGGLLMFNCSSNELIYFDPHQGSPRFKRLRFPDCDKLEVVSYTPSFLSLKDIVRPGNAEVLHVYPR